MCEITSDLRKYIKWFGDMKLSELISELKEDITIIDTEKKYYKFVSDNSFRLIYIKETVKKSGKDSVSTYDELEVINYQKVSFSSNYRMQNMFLFDDPSEEITEEEWIKEICYYFKRIPGGEEICCP